MRKQETVSYEVKNVVAHDIFFYFAIKKCGHLFMEKANTNTMELKLGDCMNCPTLINILYA